MRDPVALRGVVLRRALGIVLRASVLGGVWLTPVVVPQVARADGTADEADLHFRLGNEAYRAGEFLSALEHYLASNRLVPNQNVVFNIARTYQRLGMFPEAYRYYASAHSTETNPDARARLATALAELAGQVALVDVVTTPPGATVYVDRIDLGSIGTAPRTIALAAGTYRVLATLPGHRDAQSEPVQAVVGQRLTVQLDLTRIVGTLVVDGEDGAELRVDHEDGDPACTLPCTLPVPPGPHVLHVRQPRLAVILRPSARDTLKLLAGRAFRAPSAYEQFYQDGGRTSLGSTCCGQALRPETLYSAELEFTHRFDDEWSLLLSAHLQYAQDFIETLPVPAANDPEMLGLTYSANSSTDQRNMGADVEVRRELHSGWMFSAMLGTLASHYLDAPMAEGATANRDVPNAPYMFGSARAIFPILERLLRGALRLSVEAPRRIDLRTNDTTGWAVIADVVVSGSVDELGIQYAVGAYNLFDWDYQVPVAAFPASTMPQRGRRLMVSLGLEL